jgi:hypothetical protein
VATLSLATNAGRCDNVATHPDAAAPSFASTSSLMRRRLPSLVKRESERVPSSPRGDNPSFETQVEKVPLHSDVRGPGAFSRLSASLALFDISSSFSCSFGHLSCKQQLRHEDASPPSLQMRVGEVSLHSGAQHPLPRSKRESERLSSLRRGAPSLQVRVRCLHSDVTT